MKRWRNRKRNSYSFPGQNPQTNRCLPWASCRFVFVLSIYRSMVSCERRATELGVLEWVPWYHSRWKDNCCHQKQRQQLLGGKVSRISKGLLGIDDWFVMHAFASQRDRSRALRPWQYNSLWRQKKTPDQCEVLNVWWRAESDNRDHFPSFKGRVVQAVTDERYRKPNSLQVRRITAWCFIFRLHGIRRQSKRQALPYQKNRHHRWRSNKVRQ